MPPKQNQKSPLVLVVSIANGAIRSGDPYTWKDVVDGGHYFHPVGRYWPNKPLNYIGFRWGGVVQSVHHVDDWDIGIRFRDKGREVWRAHNNHPHFIYTLGPAMRPARTMRKGTKIRQALRVWCVLDTLLSGQCKTLWDAHKETERRKAKPWDPPRGW